MAQVVIENPILNSPFQSPSKHFEFDEEGITDKIAESRRPSSFFIPIPPPKKKGKKEAAAQQALQQSWTSDRVETNELVNNIRDRVGAWRQADYPGVTPLTRELLTHWSDPLRDRPLFFCQREAAETAIYLTEVANQTGQRWIADKLKTVNAEHNPGLPRVALKMATGTGKTIVMAMLISWQTLNKLANPQDKRFSDAFLVVTPGITIRDRLRVLLPNDVNNFYAAFDILPPDQRVRLQQAKIEIVNFHQLQRREKQEFKGVASMTKKILAEDGDLERFKESSGEMVRRVLRGLGNKKNIVVFNDEGHHCYRERPADDGAEAKITADEKQEVRQNTEAARIWLTGLEAINGKSGVRSVFDLSATPFFLRGSGYPEGTLFPWTVSDFSLIDAIESGIVKIPRVPVADDQMKGEMPAFRDLWPQIRDDLPKKGFSAADAGKEPILPKELEGALRNLYENYEKAYRKWDEFDSIQRGTPPVFIVVCNNTSVSRMVYDWIAGWEKTLSDDTVAVQAGHLAVFRNDDGSGDWLTRPNTFHINSVEIDSGNAMSDEFKKAASGEIEEFRREYRMRFPGRSADDITDEDLLREVMNTVGKKGRLGENIKCVVSVGMLTEGWDANTVTHILGIRAFGTQLLCEQVVGRGLRRISYELNSEGRFDPEYAEVYGVPFSFIPAAGTAKDPQPPKPVHRVRAMEERAAAEITFPRLIGYRYNVPTEKLTATFTGSSKLVITPEEVPTRVEVAPIAGEVTMMYLDDLKTVRMQEVCFHVAKAAVDRLRDDDGNDRPWLFPQLVKITQRWIDEGHVDCKGDAFPQMLVLAEYREAAADKIYSAVMVGSAGEKRLLPILRPYDPVGTTTYVGFDTTKEVWPTDPQKCHINFVPGDSGWEINLAQTLEQMPEVLAYVKNQGLGFFVPYTFEGRQANYMPDFIVRYNDGEEEPLNLIIEVSGQQKKDKQQKVMTATDQWVPAVNNAGAYGRWAFLEVTDPYEAKSLIRAKFPSSVGSAPG